MGSFNELISQNYIFFLENLTLPGDWANNCWDFYFLWLKYGHVADNDIWLQYIEDAETTYVLNNYSKGRIERSKNNLMV